MLLDTTIRPLYPERVIAADAGSVTLAPLGVARASPAPGGCGGQAGSRWSGRCAKRAGPGWCGRCWRGRRRPSAYGRMLDAAAFEPDPAAVGLAFSEVAVRRRWGRARRGTCPAPTATRGPVLVHGRGGPRREALRVLPALHALGLPALVISYRNDPGAASHDGRYHLGDTEWLDLEAAMAHAVAAGARRFVLVGWSMGAAIIGALLSRSALATGWRPACGTPRSWTGGPRCASRPASATSRPRSPRSPPGWPGAGSA